LWGRCISDVKKRNRLKVDRKRKDGWRGGKTGMVRKGVKQRDWKDTTCFVEATN